MDSNIDHPTDVEHTEYSRGSCSAHSEAPAADWCGWPAMQVRAVVVLGFTCDHDRAVPSPALKRRFFFLIILPFVVYAFSYMRLWVFVFVCA